MPFPYILQNAPGSFPDADKYMANWDWLQAMAKGNFLYGPGFEVWTAATSFSNPADAATLSDGWSLSKGGTSAPTADISREATTKDSGAYSMKVNITGAGSSNSYLRIKQSAANPIRFAGKSVVFSAKVKVGTANKVRLSVYDGVTTAYSSYHTGDDTWQQLTVSLACSSSLTELTVKIEITSDFTAAAYLDSSFLYVTSSTISSAAVAALEYFGPDDPLSLLIASLSVLGTLTVTGLATFNGGMAGHDGWLTSPDTWVYASASTFTISGADRTAIYTKGTRLKFTQTTVKYAVVVASSYGGGNTTVTIAVNTDYTIANAAISANYYSYDANPAGYPGWFNYTPTLTGGPADLSGYDYARFAIIGTTCMVKFYCASRTLSGSAGEIQVTLPVAGSLTTRILLPYHAYDGTSGNRVCVSELKPSDGYVKLWATVGFGNWTTSWVSLELSWDHTYQF